MLVKKLNHEIQDIYLVCAQLQ